MLLWFKLQALAVDVIFEDLNVFLKEKDTILNLSKLTILINVKIY